MEAATISWDVSREHEVGVALAAVQIDRLYKIVVVRNNYDDKEDHTFTTFINPEITKTDGKLIEDYEGCLSVRDVYGKVKRYEKVKVKALDIDGREFRVSAEGFLARIFQHEIDHTNGIVFIDHIKDDPEAFFQLDKDGKLVQLDYEKDVHVFDFDSGNVCILCHIVGSFLASSGRYSYLHEVTHYFLVALALLSDKAILRFSVSTSRTLNCFFSLSWKSFSGSTVSSSLISETCTRASTDGLS